MGINEFPWPGCGVERPFGILLDCSGEAKMVFLGQFGCIFCIISPPWFPANWVSWGRKLCRSSVHECCFPNAQRQLCLWKREAVCKFGDSEWVSICVTSDTINITSRLRLREDWMCVCDCLVGSNEVVRTTEEGAVVWLHVSWTLYGATMNDKRVKKVGHKSIRC